VKKLSNSGLETLRVTSCSKNTCIITITIIAGGERAARRDPQALKQRQRGAVPDSWTMAVENFLRCDNSQTRTLSQSTQIVNLFATGEVELPQ
jgi:hypothetical protein